MISISVTGLRELDWRLRMLAVRIRSELPSVMQTIAGTMAEDARGRIGSYQFGWPRLAASTVREKERLGYAPPDHPLLRTGKMRASIRGESDALIAEVRADRPAIFHEEGTRRMPKRSFLRPAVRDISPVARRLLAETLRAAIKET